MRRPCWTQRRIARGTDVRRAGTLDWERSVCRTLVAHATPALQPIHRLTRACSGPARSELFWQSDAATRQSRSVNVVHARWPLTRNPLGRSIKAISDSLPVYFHPPLLYTASNPSANPSLNIPFGSALSEILYSARVSSGPMELHLILHQDAQK